MDKFNTFYEKIMNNNIHLVISAFPGTGKSYATKHLKNKGYIVSDSDSSTFDKANFPQNYIDHIKKYKDKNNITFVSSHKAVRDALKKNDIEYICILPTKDLKDEYIERYKQRGSSESFIELLDKNWEIWLDEMSIENTHKIFLTKPNEYILDVIDNLIEKYK